MQWKSDLFVDDDVFSRPTYSKSPLVAFIFFIAGTAGKFILQY